MYVFNKIYDKIHEKTVDHPVARVLFERTENLAKQARKERLSVVDKIQQKVLDRVVGAKVRGAFGNALRFCISGGAALSEEIAKNNAETAFCDAVEKCGELLAQYFPADKDDNPDELDNGVVILER